MKKYILYFKLHMYNFHYFKNKIKDLPNSFSKVSELVPPMTILLLKIRICRVCWIFV